MDRLTLLGQPLVRGDQIIHRFRDAKSVDDLTPLLKLEDNYTAVYERGDEVFIVNSPYSFNSYFYSHQRGAFLHGDSLFAVAQKGPVDLSWNHEAIADLIGHLHLIGDETLVKGVRTVPLGTILHFDGSTLHRRTLHREELIEPLPGGKCTPELLLDIYLEALSAGIGRRPLITGSAGLDSRVNLAGMVHLGFRPEVAVMGRPEAKDVQVVKAMAKALDLRVNHVLLRASDYLDSAYEICRATNGVKPFDHWHTYAFALRAGYDHTDRAITGHNGEHVRAFGFDFGVVARTVDALSRIDRRVVSDRLLRRIYELRTLNELRESELRACPPAFIEYYGRAPQSDKIMSVMPDMSFVWQCDSWVLEQRRRGFQSAGLALYALKLGTYAPYMRKRWVDAGWKLALNWRLGGRWHRYAVERLCPALLAFPDDHDPHRLRVRPPALYWVPPLKRLRNPRGATPYMDYADLLRRREVLALLDGHLTELEDFMPRATLRAIIDEQARTGARGRLFGILTGMAVWRASMRAAEGRCKVPIDAATAVARSS